MSFENDLLMSSIRHQIKRLHDLASAIETDEKIDDHWIFYTQKLKEVRRALGKIANKKEDYLRSTIWLNA